MSYISFDLEIAKIPQEGVELNDMRPLGITCAALYDGLTKETRFYSGVPQMSTSDAVDLVRNMIDLTNSGNKIVTLNGLGFDFRTLAEESGLLEECRWLALNHIDIGFQFFTEHGFMVGLDAIDNAIGGTGKTEGMSGLMAPEMWLRGEYDKVLEYLGNDVVMTDRAIRYVVQNNRIEWVTKANKISSRYIGNPKLVKTVLTWKHNTPTWMSNPWPREKFTAWLGL